MGLFRKNREPLQPELLIDGASENTRNSYDSIVRNLTYSLIEEGCKTIGFISTEENTGRETAAVNTAAALAKNGKKVLLIDGDLKKAAVTALLDAGQNPGISDTLAGQARLKDCFMTVQAMGFYMIPSGYIPPDAAAILASDKFSRLIEALREYYDYIIVDLPPMTEKEDGDIISEAFDGYIITAAEKITRHGDLMKLVSMLRQKKARTLGFISIGA